MTYRALLVLVSDDDPSVPITTVVDEAENMYGPLGILKKLVARIEALEET